MAKKYDPEELKLIETVVSEMKKLTKKYGYEYVIVGATKYIKTTKDQKKLIAEIKQSEAELEELKEKLG